MKRIWCWFAVCVLCFGVSACTPKDGGGTMVPTTTGSTTATTTVPITGETALSVYELAWFQQFFTAEAARFLVPEYTAPEEISLFWLVCDGLSEATAEEEAAVDAAYPDGEPLDVMKAARADIEWLVAEYTGLTPDDLDQTEWDSMLYLEEYDAYYRQASDHNGVSPYIVGGYRTAAGQVVLRYVTVSEEHGTVTLTPHGYSYRFVSNERKSAWEN